MLVPSGKRANLKFQVGNHQFHPLALSQQSLGFMGELSEFSVRGLSSFPSCFYAPVKRLFLATFSRADSHDWQTNAKSGSHLQRLPFILRKVETIVLMEGPLESALTTITLCFSEATTLLRRDGSSAKAAAFVVNSIVYLWQCCLFKGWLSHNSTKDQGPRTEQSPVLSALRLLRM